MIAISTLRVLFITAAVIAMTVRASSEDLKKITIVMSSDSIAGSVARTVGAMGLYEKHGLDAKTTPLENTTLATAALISGSANFATIAPTDLIFAQARGQNIVALFTSYSGYGIVLTLSKETVEKLNVSPTAPVSEKLKALDGLMIASPSPTSSVNIAISSSAKSAGAIVKPVHMSLPASVAALRSGAIQGFGSSAPYYVQPVIDGSGVIWVNGPKGEFPFAPDHSTYLVTTRDYAVANPEIVKSVVAALGDFGKAAVERPADVKAAVAKLFPTVDSKTLDLLFETEIYGFMLRKITVDNIARDIEFVKASGAQLPGIAI